MNHFVIDRVEGTFAVVECPDGSFQNIPLSQLPQGAKEGSILSPTPQGWQLDPQAEHQAKTRVRSKLDGLLKKK
jgi:hypothetical protein